MFALLKGQDPASGSQAMQWQEELISAGSPAQQQETSFLDRLAAPTVFLQQALLFETQLFAEACKAAVATLVKQYPAFGCRLASTQDGGLQAVPQTPTGSSGVAFLLGHSSTLSLQQLQGLGAATGHAAAAAQTAEVLTDTAAVHRARQKQTGVREIPDLLFSHLPGSLTPDYVNSNLPLAHVALLQLQGGGSLLGVRMSHFVGDWTSLRLLLRCFAAAYSNTAQQQQQQQQQLLLLPHLVPAAPLLNKLATALQQQQQQQQSGGGEGWVPLRLKPLQQEDTEKFAKLAAIGTQTEKDAHGAGSNGVDGSSGSNADGSSGSNCGDTDNSSSSSSQRPVRLSYQVSLERIKQLKQQLLAKAAPSSSSSNGSSRWCTTHNALLVSVLAAFGRLPSRQGLVHDVSIAADMRDRLPAAQLQLLGPQEQQQLGIAIGNFFASAIAEDCCLSGGSSRAQLAQALHAAVNRAAEVWLPDLAWAAGVKHFQAAGPATTAAAGGGKAGGAAAAAEAATEAAAEGKAEGTAALEAAAGVSAGEVTWRRLHAMGPSALLQQQMELGLLASLSTTQWPLDYQADTCFAGQLPCLSVPSFSQPQPYPLVLTQQATAAQGGGWMVHVFLDAAEAAAMQQAAAAQGGL